MKRQNTFKLFNRHNQVRGRISTLVLSLTLLLPVALTACVSAVDRITRRVRYLGSGTSTL